MKTPLLYGFLLALANFLLTLVMFIAGMHSDPARLGTAQWIAGLGSLAIAILFLVLGIRAKRAAAAPEEAFGYGKAFGAGFGIQLWASVFAVFTTYLYSAVIDPHFNEVVAQAQVAKMQERGMSSDQIEKAQSMMHLFTGPTFQAIGAFVGSLFIGTIIVLIAAAFLKRSPERDPNAI